MRSSCCCIVILIFITIVALLSSPLIRWILTTEEQSDYPSYNDCAPSVCGNSTIRYPFTNCGAGPIDCIHNQILQITLYNPYDDEFHGRVVGNIMESSYHTRTLQIAQDMGDSSLFYLGSMDSSVFSMDDNPPFFKLSPGYTVGTILNCTQQYRPGINKTFTRLHWGETDSQSFFYNGSFDDYYGKCISYSVVVPTDKKYNISGDKNLEQFNQRGFQITWTIPDSCLSCNATGGRCYFRHTESSSDIDYMPHGDYCVCRYGLYKWNCSAAHRVGYIVSVGVMAELFFGVCALFSIVVVFSIVVRRQFCCTRTATEEQSIRAFMDPVDSTTPSVENFLNYYSSQVPTRYSYGQIMTYTNNLVERLGKGGFGTVYKGKLPTGSGIAVKILDESKQSEQQFIREVATVGTTCHVNLVRLLGYCSQGSIKALVYEYMVNGSLEKYIHRGRHDELDWKQLYSIALGTARGIAYLHEECRNRILHFDIKPHNVLLDENFLPKVADFGLAQITNKEESHISVANRGTVGYAAPEMWSRMYGVVSGRSDVYSYGMLVMEMVGARQNIDFHNQESRSSRFFYAEWAFKQVEKGQFENLRKGNMSEEEQGIAKRLSLVGLWCIQFNASRRPPMRNVIKMLEGGEAEISMPPFPFHLLCNTMPLTHLLQHLLQHPRLACPHFHSIITAPFPLPADPPMTAVQHHASDPSSSTSYSLEVETNNPKSTHAS